MVLILSFITAICLLYIYSENNITSIFPYTHQVTLKQGGE